MFKIFIECTIINGVPVGFGLKTANKCGRGEGKDPESRQRPQDVLAPDADEGKQLRGSK